MNTIDIPEADLAKVAHHTLQFVRYPDETEPSPAEFAYCRELTNQALAGMTMAG